MTPPSRGWTHSMTELLVGTRKGLFVLEGERGLGAGDSRAARSSASPSTMRCATRAAGASSHRSPRPFWGPRIWFTDDLDGDWQPARGVALPKGGKAALKRIWVITAGERAGTLYAGGDPGVLFESRDDGASWELNQALWEHPSRPRWRRDSGGLSVHSIVPWPGDPDRLALAISAAGIWLTEDGGASWQHGNDGIVADYLPEETREHAIDLCVHHLERAVTRPERLFMQFHGGVYRSDDAGRSWIDIAAGLPHDFGFPIVLDPADPDSAFVIPVTTSDRVTDGRVAVWETRDAGAAWTAREQGLPQHDAYLSVLRQAFSASGEGAAPRALLRGDVGRDLRLLGRRRELVEPRPAAAGDRLRARGSRATLGCADDLHLRRSCRPPLLPVGPRLVGRDARQGLHARRRRGHHRPRGRGRDHRQGRGARDGRRRARRAALGRRAHERARQCAAHALVSRGYRRDGGARARRRARSSSRRSRARATSRSSTACSTASRPRRATTGRRCASRR